MSKRKRIILGVTGSDTNVGLEIQPKGTGDVTILGTATDSGTILLREDTDNGTNEIGFKAPAALAGTTTFELPDGDGTNTQVIQTNGSAVLSWVANASSTGSLVFLDSKTASASPTLDFDDVFSATYDNYLIVVENLIAATDDVEFNAVLSTDSGSTYASSGYKGGAVGRFPVDLSNFGAYSTTDIIFTDNDTLDKLGNASGETIGITLTMYKPFDATVVTTWSGHGMYTAASGKIGNGYYGGSLAASEVDSIRFIMSSGNITSGTVKIYGIANA